MSKKPAKSRVKNAPRTRGVNEAAANAVAPRTKLLEVNLLASEARHTIADRSKPPRSFSFHVNSNAEHQGVLNPENKKKIGERIRVDLTLIVDGRDVPEDREPKLHLSTTYRAIYELAPGKKLSETQLTSFAVFHTARTVWPYMSESISSITTRMGLPSLRLPMFQAGKVHVTKSVRQPPHP
jgi:preprotein translocase subunit SecB